MSKEAMKLALEALEIERDNYQDWDEKDGAPEYIHEAITALREALAEQPAQTATYTCGVCGVSMQMEQPAKQEPVALPEGKKLILVDGSFDDLMFWLERCEDKGHLENCPDLVEPWESFSYEPYTSPPAQQEPVAWIEHEWSGTGLRHLHFEKREPAVRDEVVNPIWTPLYTSPPAQRTWEEWFKWWRTSKVADSTEAEIDFADFMLIVRAVESEYGI